MTYQSQVPYGWETRKEYLDLPFPISEYHSRLKRIRAAMEENRLDYIVIFGDSGDPGDLVYVSNFTPFGGKCAIVIHRELPPVLITNAILHGEPINSYAWMTWIEEFIPVNQNDAEFALALTRVLTRAWKGSEMVGIVGAKNLPFIIWEKVRENLTFSWMDFWFEFTMIKSVRSDNEVSLCKEVGSITAKAMKAAVESIAVGRTENEVASVALKTMLESGAHDRSFQTIVNAGKKGGLKHCYPTDRKIVRGDMIYLDMGAMKFGYQADMSRTVIPGGADPRQKEVLDTILEGYSTLTKMMQPGIRTSELIAKAEDLAEASGLRSKYDGRIYLGLIVHHAIATSFFEIPSLGLPDTVLQENMSFAFEPMAHILDFGTAVIEDTVLITSKGVESLTPYEIIHW